MGSETATSTSLRGVAVGCVFRCFLEFSLNYVRMSSTPIPLSNFFVLFSLKPIVDGKNSCCTPKIIQNRPFSPYYGTLGQIRNIFMFFTSGDPLRTSLLLGSVVFFRSICCLPLGFIFSNLPSYSQRKYTQLNHKLRMRKLNFCKVHLNFPISKIHPSIFVQQLLLLDSEFNYLSNYFECGYRAPSHHRVHFRKYCHMLKVY